ncbi:helix-turn-helix transcriptional regulator [Moraxellaceae bacterium AER2_44_116]|nr:helix-turn-helix transcriptional regulator [Moraxellaceae bacterium AER2_44_116]
MSQGQLDLNIEDQAAQCAEEAELLAQEIVVAIVEENKKPRKEPTEFEKMVAERFVKARNLNGLKPQEAAIKMRIRNKKVLSQIENAHRLPTNKMLVIAANAYGVSADFLLGMSEDDDRSSSIATRAAIDRQLEAKFNIVKKVLADTTYDYAKAVNDFTVREMVNVVEEVCLKFNRFCELNPIFLDMRAGAPVQDLMLTLMPLTRKVKNDIQKREGLIDLHNQQLDSLVQRQLFGVING